MEKRLYRIIFVLILLFAGCDAIVNLPPLQPPADVTDVTTTPGPRSMLIRWTEPEDDD